MSCNTLKDGPGVWAPAAAVTTSAAPAPPGVWRSPAMTGQLPASASRGVWRSAVTAELPPY
eukprot:3802549-Prymnesium_polylepis.1